MRVDEAKTTRAGAITNVNPRKTIAIDWKIGAVNGDAAAFDRAARLDGGHAGMDIHDQVSSSSAFQYR